MHDLHKSIIDQINSNNLKYKILTNSQSRFKEFKIGDYVIVRIRPERFPQGVTRKLQTRIARPLKIHSKIGVNAKCNI